MAVIDVVKCEMWDSEFCKKFPSDNLRTGSQLIVHPSQSAIFVRDGKICDVLGPGKYTLSTENLPLLHSVINIPFGGDTPFQAEVWFINHSEKLNMKWGTMSPFQLEDPKYGIIVPIRAFGQYGLCVCDAETFLKSLVGNMRDFSAEKVADYFKGIMMSCLNSAISKRIISDQISILDINQHLLDISSSCKEEISKTFNKYGIELSAFSFISISVPNDDPSIVKLKEAKDMAARLKIMGRDVYQMERSYNVLEKAAGNEGIGGTMMALGAGLGAGVGVGQGIVDVHASAMKGMSECPPPIPQETTYHLYVNGKQIGGQTIQSILSMITQGNVNGETLVWKAGMPQWDKLSNIPELSSLLGTVPPPIPPQI